MQVQTHVKRTVPRLGGQAGPLLQLGGLWQEFLALFGTRQRGRREGAPRPVATSDPVRHVDVSALASGSAGLDRRISVIASNHAGKCAAPLRERPEDIEPLVRHFVQRFAARMRRQIEEIPTETFGVMRRYPWPGNVRELENLIERAVILSPGPRLMIPLEHLARRSTALARDDSASTLELVKRAHVVRVLEEMNWTIGGPQGAATRLGMKRTTLQSFMKRSAIARRA